MALIELAAPVLGRALEPFSILALVEFLRTRRQTIELASYDDRLMEAARALDIPLREL